MLSKPFWRVGADRSRLLIRNGRACVLTDDNDDSRSVRPRDTDFRTFTVERVSGSRRWDRVLALPFPELFRRSAFRRVCPMTRLEPYHCFPRGEDGWGGLEPYRPEMASRHTPFFRSRCAPVHMFSHLTLGSGSYEFCWTMAVWKASNINLINNLV